MEANPTRRVVVVSRPSELDGLLARHGTPGQARFFVESRGGDLREVEERHARLRAARHALSQAIPVDWRRVEISRSDLARFLFEPEDIVVIVGQDGLVANVAKYLCGQPVLGFDPDPGQNAGVLVRHAPREAEELLRSVGAGTHPCEKRSMVEAQLAGGERLVALNEIFVGHRSHQSARYTIEVDGGTEAQSSSGLIVSTGTGATGWASSIERERRESPELPAAGSQSLAWFVREAWASCATGTTLTAGRLEAGEHLRVVSHMDGGVLFGDGIETDYLALPWGQPAVIQRASVELQLVV